ncbi:MAG: tetratricopeptide repeat protein [Promethearchaeota archaeon]
MSATSDSKVSALISKLKDLVTKYQKTSDSTQQQQFREKISENVSKLVEEAERLYEKGQFQESLNLYTPLLDLVSKLGIRDLEGILNEGIGTVYLAWRDYTKALKFLQQARDIAQLSRDTEAEDSAQYRIAETYRRMKYYKEALEILKGVLKNKQKRDRLGEGVALNQIGLVYLFWGKYKDAMKRFQRALDLFQLIGDAYYEAVTHAYIGETLREMGKYTEAVDHLTKAMPILVKEKDRETLGLVYFNLGALYVINKRFTEALEAFELSNKINPRDARSWAERGWLLERLGFTDKAIACFRQAIALDPENTKIRDQLAKYGVYI